MLFLSTHAREKVPFVSSLAHSKLLLRAVTQDDLKLLKELIADRNHVAKVCAFLTWHCSRSSILTLKMFCPFSPEVLEPAFVKSLPPFPYLWIKGDYM